jgi:hypothetical protein
MPGAPNRPAGDPVLPRVKWSRGSSHNRLSLLVINADDQERVYRTLIVDPERREWPSADRLAVPQNVLRPLNRIRREPLYDPE